MKLTKHGCGDQFPCFKRQKHAHNCVHNPKGFQEMLRQEQNNGIWICISLVYLMITSKLQSLFVVRCWLGLYWQFDHCVHRIVLHLALANPSVFFGPFLFRRLQTGLVKTMFVSTSTSPSPRPYLPQFTNQYQLEDRLRMGEKVKHDSHNLGHNKEKCLLHIQILSIVKFY